MQHGVATSDLQYLRDLVSAWWNLDGAGLDRGQGIKKCLRIISHSVALGAEGLDARSRRRRGSGIDRHGGKKAGGNDKRTKGTASDGKRNCRGSHSGKGIPSAGRANARRFCQEHLNEGYAVPCQKNGRETGPQDLQKYCSDQRWA